MIRPIRTLRGGPILVALALSTPAFARCPISDGATLVVKAAVGDLQVDTTGRDAAEVQVESNAVQVQETCGKDTVQFISNGPDPIRGTIAWKITVPRTVHLDLVTMAGNINVGDVDGNVVLRTGTIAGSVFAEAGRTIYIAKAGEVKATTNAGDISVGDAARINAKSGGGNITSRRVRGPFQGHTESGDIRLDSAASWVEASTRAGNIFVRLVPDNLDGDLHMDLDAGIGDVTVYLPPRLRASIEASVQRPAFQSQQIISEFRTVPVRPAQGLIPNKFYSGTRSESLLNGGGNKIVLHTALGKITIRKN